MFRHPFMYPVPLCVLRHRNVLPGEHETLGAALAAWPDEIAEHMKDRTAPEAGYEVDHDDSLIQGFR